MNAAELAQALREAVLAQDLGATPDPQDAGQALGARGRFPSLDLAVVAFPDGGAPVAANVLFSREHPQGLVATLGPGFGPVQQLRYLADQRDATGQSIAWRPGSDWSRMDWQPLYGEAGPRVVAPYPASLLKLMVLVGLAHLIDQGRSGWWQPWGYQGREQLVGDWAFQMTAYSSNEATSALIALLHALGAIRREPAGETHHELHQLFARLGLPTLRLANTRPDGGWGNGAGAGVGQIQMTAWDTVRLLWWLDPQAPPPPWLPADAPRLSAESRSQVLHCLQEQALHEILSSAALGGVPGWVAGLPARLPARWLQLDGTLQAGDRHYRGDLRRFAQGGEVWFAHKTGNTENYASDAGIVTGIAPRRRHYLVALLSNLGARYAPHPDCATPWGLPALGAAIDARLTAWLESSP